MSGWLALALGGSSPLGAYERFQAASSQIPSVVPHTQVWKLSHGCRCRCRCPAPFSRALAGPPSTAAVPRPHVQAQVLKKLLKPEPLRTAHFCAAEGGRLATSSRPGEGRVQRHPRTLRLQLLPHRHAHHAAYVVPSRGGAPPRRSCMFEHTASRTTPQRLMRK